MGFFERKLWGTSIHLSIYQTFHCNPHQVWLILTIWGQVHKILLWLTSMLIGFENLLY